MEVAVTKSDALDNFIDFLFDGLTGYAYLAAKTPGTSEWHQEFFNYPVDANKLKTTIRKASKSLEIYLAPALYSESVLTSKNPATRENVKVSQVVWTEFDGNAPDWNTTDFAGPPSVIIQSSASTNQHVYWRLNEPLTDIDLLEDINRRIVYNFGADNSAWDATQVLRPPLTQNHKRGLPVRLLVDSTYSYDTTLFDVLNPAPTKESLIPWELGEVPDPVAVLSAYTLAPNVQALLERDVALIPDRSNALTFVAYGCCEAGMKDVEVFSIIRAFDGVLKKYVDRKNRDEILCDIILTARQKHPYVEENELVIDELEALTFGYQSFMAAEFEFDWVIEGMLMDRGSMLMAGPSGIGKTQLTMQFMKHVALGKHYLHYPINRPRKVLFLSLEMSHPELQVFFEKGDGSLTLGEKQTLERNLMIYASGEPWALNKKEGQDRLIKLLDVIQPEGLFIDSIGSSIIGNINAADVVQSFNNFMDHVRQKYGMFVWYIHHTRKAAQGGHIGSQDDIYGDMYLNARASSSYLVLPGKDKTIRIRNTKKRLSAREDDYWLERTEELNFVKITQAIDDNVDHNLSDNAGADNQFKM